MLRAEERLGAVDGELFNHVNMFAAAVPAFAGVAFGIFVGEAGALRFHHGTAGEIFRGNQLNVLKLPLTFFFDGFGDLRVDFGNAAARLEFFADVTQLADTAFVPVSAFKYGAQKGVDGLFDVVQRSTLGAETEDIRVVVEARHGGVFGVVHQGGADLREAVGRDAHADAAGADENTEIGFACDDLVADLRCKVRVVHGFRSEDSEIGHWKPLSREVGVEGLFNSNPP